MGYFDWINPIGAEWAQVMGDVEFSVAVEDAPVLSGVRGLLWEQEADGRQLATCDKNTWRTVQRILERAGVDCYVT